ncbi:MAG TPA: hypothetical protein VMV01_03170, partial [Planctomycetota bacterium]|nr:hypothetical protein [Planctomycetota bacterium]
MLAGEEPLDPLGVPEPGRAFLAGLCDAFAGQLAHGLEHVEARIAAQLGSHQQALLHERCERVERFEPGVGRDRCGRLLGEAASQDAEAAEEDALLGPQQVQAPVERGAQRLVPLRRIPLAATQQRERLVEARDHGLRRQHAHARGRKLDGERQSVEAPAQLGHGRAVVVADAEVRPDLSGTLLEQDHRGRRFAA